MDYKKSRDVAWQILSRHKIKELPVRVAKICKAEKIKLFTYEEGAELIRRLHLEAHTENGNDAFTIGRVIFYDDTTSRGRQRFSVAHELGHVLLHSTDSPTVQNREISPADNPIESEANVFASRILAPMCVLHYLNVQSAEEIAEKCDISIVAARIRFERLCLLRERDREMRVRTGRGCFLSSPLERAVYANFYKYIKKNRRE